MSAPGKITVCVALLAASLLVSCAAPSAEEPNATTVTSPVDRATEQRVKNGCLEDLKAQASPSTPPPGQLHVRKATLSTVKFLGEVTRVELPGEAKRYDLGIEFAYKLGDDDSGTAKKLCRINLADSTVEWQSLQ
ncbi:hypothetical protein ACFRAU_07065 [Arthrobacter sp. NPDC056691]|uniref:hypothetical protein n=1 Tax=Arthrobacter sp. NPDC056691 TaxID=3345913 RepID=UPI0036734F6C